MCAQRSIRLPERQARYVGFSGASTSCIEDVHGFSEVAEERTWLADFNRLVEGFAGNLDELLRVVVDTPDRVRLVQVCVEAYQQRLA